jgi:succinate dehydrogenase/fumarate reductase flavoprotein subunit
MSNVVGIFKNPKKLTKEDEALLRAQDRVKRITASLDRINDLMTQLKALQKDN